MISDHIGRYRILAPLGKGAIGEVFRAYDPELGREVAIKVISRSGVEDLDEIRQRFRREVQLAAHLKHPNIITLFDVGLEHQPPYVVTELLAGGTLREYLKSGPIPWQEALALLEPICNALNYAHEAGIIHRDVKPSNIMFADDANRTIKLADFGLAHRQEDEHLTQSGGIVGTIAYMSPEQANGEAVDRRTDIFSFGLIMFEAIAGYNPLHGNTVSQTLLKAISFEPINLTDIEKVVPDQVAALVEQAITRDRQHRYSSCSQLIEDITGCLAMIENSSDTENSYKLDSALKDSELTVPVHIENPRGLNLPPDAREILQGVFRNYRRVSIREELAGGYSGSRVFVVVPVRKDHTPELPAVVKMGPLRLIEQEWHAYQTYVRDQLSGITQITGEPVFPTGISWGGLRYQLVGSGAVDFNSFSQAYHQATAVELRFMLADRLFKRLAALWRFNFPTPAFNLAASYDHLLPVNLLIRPGETRTDATIPVIRAGEVGVPRLSRGDAVRLSGFVVSEVDSNQEIITLDWPQEEKDFPGTYRVRLLPETGLERFQVDLVIDNIDGIVTMTRQDLIKANVLEVMGWNFDTETPKLSSPGLPNLPNPLVHLPQYLSVTPNVRLANIHGDLNPENILVDNKTWDVRLIDFAASRRDHVLHDFLRLDTGIITRLLPETLQAAHLPPEIIFQFYRRLHCNTFTGQGWSSFDMEPVALQKPFAILETLRKAARTYFYDPAEWNEYYQGLILYLMGSLKYKNLSKLGKKIAFYGAASLLYFMDEPPPCQEPISNWQSRVVVRDTEAAGDLVPATSTRLKRNTADLETILKPQVQKKPDDTRDINAWFRANWLTFFLIGTFLIILFGLLIYYLPFVSLDATATVPSSSEPTIFESPVGTKLVTGTALSSPVNQSSPMPSPTKVVIFGDVSKQDAIIALLIDTSVSMDQQLTGSLEGISGLVSSLDQDDQVAVYKLGGELLKLEPAGRVADVRQELVKKVDSLFAEGQSDLYAGLCLAVDDIVILHEAQKQNDFTYGLIVVTDGKDSALASSRSEDEVFACLDSAREQFSLKIIILTYDAETNRDFLEKLVERYDSQLILVHPGNIVERIATLSFDS